MSARIERRVDAMERNMARMEETTAEIERLLDVLEKLVDTLVPPPPGKSARPPVATRHLELVGKKAA